ncbi:DEAD/DEAH box helicase [Paracoccus cavernae]|uniref:DEAD/DEAH box helicase n=1 Tax=Paracoccus cavernae TaxID=1571207 RepID=UPI0035F37567
MTTFDIAAPLAAALAAKGYASLTSVQQAVLAEDAAGRDLLVSAQTGSGKTVAFGIAMAPEVLGHMDRLMPAERPLALAIAPTRELALQVARELQWLYGEAGAQIATCVGGMDYRTERRALDRGAHIVVGTPGRLRDHIERGSLNLTGLRAAVLDEADEMLDLGFREDLEFILSAAPEDRRTLMFSATVPPAIEKLAKDFQRSALRISAVGEARQHGDIQYRALSIAARDRENAIFNLLRFYEAQTAIIFCKTRANVNYLLSRMGNRGFRVVALSGELSQQERMHALQALRDGRARICIATDVAARGIDLPGLELVIHADLPTNSETLLHRSGRTGRAGAKGVSALIVQPSEYKKAQRLLQGAKVVAEWGTAPSSDEVRAKDDTRMLETPSLTEPMEDEAAMAAHLVKRFGAEQVAAAFIKLWREGRPAPEEINETVTPAQPSAPRQREAFGASVWYLLTVGHSGRAEARWLLPKICEAGNITRDAIGAIRVKTNETFVQIAAEMADRFHDGAEIEEGIVMRRLADEPVFGPETRGERPERAPRRYEDRGDRGGDRGERYSAPRARRDDDGDSRPPRPPRGEKPAYVRKPSRFVEDDGQGHDAASARSERKSYDPAAENEKLKKPRWSAADRAKKDGEGFSRDDRAAPAKFGGKPASKYGKPAGKPAPAKAGFAKPARAKSGDAGTKRKPAKY